MNQQFRLYPEEKHFWSFNDYAAVLRVVRRLRPRRVLEFGPGSSTLALIEGGAQRVDSCEDDPHWLDVYRERLQAKYPEIVRIRGYHFGEPLTIPAVDSRHYDLAFIDGPRETPRRPAAIEYACARSRFVLVALECFESAGLAAPVSRIAGELNRGVAWIHDTGPLAGAFALISPTNRPRFA